MVDIWWVTDKSTFLSLACKVFQFNVNSIIQLKCFRISQMMIMAYISIGSLASATPNFHKGLSAASRVLPLVNDITEKQNGLSLLEKVFK